MIGKQSGSGPPWLEHVDELSRYIRNILQHYFLSAIKHSSCSHFSVQPVSYTLSSNLQLFSRPFCLKCNYFQFRLAVVFKDGDMSILFMGEHKVNTNIDQYIDTCFEGNTKFSIQHPVKAHYTHQIMVLTL